MKILAIKIFDLARVKIMSKPKNTSIIPLKTRKRINLPGFLAEIKPINPEKIAPNTRLPKSMFLTL